MRNARFPRYRATTGGRPLLFTTHSSHFTTHDSLTFYLCFIICSGNKIFLCHFHQFFGSNFLYIIYILKNIILIYSVTCRFCQGSSPCKGCLFSCQIKACNIVFPLSQFFFRRRFFIELLKFFHKKLFP